MYKFEKFIFTLSVNVCVYFSMRWIHDYLRLSGFDSTAFVIATILIMWLVIEWIDKKGGT